MASEWQSDKNKSFLFCRLQWAEYAKQFLTDLTSTENLIYMRHYAKCYRYRGKAKKLFNLRHYQYSGEYRHVYK